MIKMIFFYDFQNEHWRDFMQCDIFHIDISHLILALGQSDGYLLHFLDTGVNKLDIYFYDVLYGELFQDVWELE